MRFIMFLCTLGNIVSALRPLCPILWRNKLIDWLIDGGVTDPIPTCGVVTSPPIRGQNVTLSCTTEYQQLSEGGRLNPDARISPSISWESAASTLIANSSTDDVRQGRTFGATLQANVSTLASGTEIPSYNCTTTFDFLNVSTVGFVFALNSLTWTCVSAPVLTWCK